MNNNKFEEIKKEFLGKEFRLLDLEGIGEYSLDYIFPDNAVFNLEIGKYDTKMVGGYSYKNEFCEEDENIYFIFETVGGWEVIDNSQCSNIYTTCIDDASISIKIIDVRLV